MPFSIAGNSWVAGIRLPEKYSSTVTLWFVRNSIWSPNHLTIPVCPEPGNQAASLSKYFSWAGLFVEVDWAGAAENKARINAKVTSDIPNNFFISISFPFLVHIYKPAGRTEEEGHSRRKKISGD
jgi:hypothetical protein